MGIGMGGWKKKQGGKSATLLRVIYAAVRPPALAVGI